MDTTNRSSLARGATIYVVCVAFAKFLGIVWIIPVSLLIGVQGLGIYSNAYSLYTILQQLATSGFPLAMGKLIAERLALKKHAEVEQIYRVTRRSVLFLGIVAFILMWFGAPLYAHLISLREPGKASSDLVPSIRALSLMLLVIPSMSSLRGYLQGFGRLEAPAYSQTVEQLFRVLAMLVGTYVVWHVTKSVAWGAAAATFGGFVGGVAGVLLLVVAARPIRREYGGVDLHKSPHTDRDILKLVYRVAFPIALGGLVVPIANLVDSTTVTNLLQSVGETYQEATGNYGILTRQAVYLIQLPLAFAYAIGVSVLPAISQAKALRQQDTIKSHITNTLRSMFFITFATAAILLVLSRPINFVLNNSYQGATIISAVSFMSIFSSLELISTYMLQGLGKMYRPVRNMFIGVLIKLIFNFILIFVMKSVLGAAIATTIGYLFSSALNVMAVRKYARVQFSTIRLAAPFFVATIPTVIAMWLTNKLLKALVVAIPMTYVQNVILILVVTAVGAVVYLAMTLRIGAIRENELKNIPGVGRRLMPFARKLYRGRRRARQ